MSRHRVRHVAVRATEEFELYLGEKIISAEFDAPWYYLIIVQDVVTTDTLTRIDEDPFFNGHPVSE